MNDDKLFLDSQEELKYLCDNIVEMKLQLKEMATKLGQIERHAKRSFGSSSITAKTQNKRFIKGSNNEQPTVNSKQALELFDELALDYHKNKGDFENKFSKIVIPNLKLMARELGITFRSKPSRKMLFSAIKGRINERILLSENTNIMRPNDKVTTPTSLELK